MSAEQMIKDYKTTHSGCVRSDSRPAWMDPKPARLSPLGWAAGIGFIIGCLFVAAIKR